MMILVHVKSLGSFETARLLIGILHRDVEENDLAFTAGGNVVLTGLRVGELAGELNVDELDRNVCVKCVVSVCLSHVRSLVVAHVRAVCVVVGDHF